MSYNVPSYDTARFSFGPGVLYMGVQGTTPLVDIGAVRGDAQITVERTMLEMFQGSPQSLVKKYAVKEDVRLKLTGVEWNVNNLSYALGAGVTSAAGAQEIFEFGGDTAVSNRALRYVHRTPDGGTVDCHFFAMEGAGKLEIAIKQDDFHEFPMEFSALEGTVDFTNAALATNKKKFKIIRTKV